MSEQHDRTAVVVSAEQSREIISAAVEESTAATVETAESLAGLGGILTLAPPSRIVLADDVGNRPYAATRSRTDVPIVALMGVSDGSGSRQPGRVDAVVEYDGANLEATADRVVTALQEIDETDDISSTEDAPDESLGDDRLDSGPVTTDPAKRNKHAREHGARGGTRKDVPIGQRRGNEGGGPVRENGGVGSARENSSDLPSGARIGSDDPRASGLRHQAEGIDTVPVETSAETEQTGPFLGPGAIEAESLFGTVVIGASTGGPGVVTSVLSALPSQADLRVLVVQHLRDAIVPQFAARIDETTDFPVSVAPDEGTVSPGEVVVARGNSHLLVDRDFGDELGIRNRYAPPRNDVRPAADETMESAADVVDGPLVGVILTGIGIDGAAGLQSIKRAGGRTIVQDEATSNIFGMPAAAIEAGVADDVLPGDRIASGIVRATLDQQE